MKLDISNILPNKFTGLSGDLPALENLGTITLLRRMGTTVFALGAITCMIFMLLNITKLGAAGDSEKGRKSAIQGILFSGVGVAILGGLSVYLGFFWNVLR